MEGFDGAGVEAAICREVLRLMREQPVHKIRVTSLCAACGVNRSTFYDHFSNVYDVVGRIEEGVLDELDGLAGEVREKDLGAYETSLAFLDYFAARRDVLRALLANETSWRLLGAVDEKLRALFAERAAGPHNMEHPDAADALRYATAGYYRFYLDFVLDEAPVDSELVARRAALAEAFCTAGLERCLDEG